MDDTRTNWTGNNKSVSDPGSAVEAKDLERRFGQFVAVNRVSFTVAKGEVFGLLGPNGAGKSTIIKMLCGLLALTGGSATVAGFDVRHQPERVKTRIGYMSQRFSLYDDLTVEENIDFFGGIYQIPSAKKRRRKEWVIEMAGLKEQRRIQAGILAAGWKRRLALGCAILHEPPMVFLDEPTSGVDPISRRQFWDLIYALAGSGQTVFVTTHYMDEAEYCNRLVLMYRGELIACSSPDSLKRGLIRHTVIEVVCHRPVEAQVEVARIPGVKETAIFGSGIHAVTAQPETVIPQLRVRLFEQGFHVTRLAPPPSSLEDVFVSLIEGHDRAGETAKTPLP